MVTRQSNSGSAEGANRGQAQFPATSTIHIPLAVLAPPKNMLWPRLANWLNDGGRIMFRAASSGSTSRRFRAAPLGLCRRVSH